MSSKNTKNTWFYVAIGSWVGLIALTLVWDGLTSPLYFILLIKLAMLLLPLRGLLAERVYTFQYCSMLILAFFVEGVMRVVSVSPLSQTWATVEIALSVAFFVACLAYLKQFKIKKEKSNA